MIIFNSYVHQRGIRGVDKCFEGILGPSEKLVDILRVGNFSYIYFLQYSKISLCKDVKLPQLQQPRYHFFFMDTGQS